MPIERVEPGAVFVDNVRPVSRVIGIDLGTTNCCVAVVEDGAPHVLENRAGYKTTPSIVALDQSGERVVGQLAQRQAVSNPEHTVYAVKRLLGRPFASETVQAANKQVSYTIEAGPMGDARVRMRGVQHTVAEISAILLQEMRLVAEDRLGHQIDKAVVTVPAYFTDSQRQAVRDAGLIAGLEVLRIINEPTAAALAYGFRRDVDKTVAVYDLGGGTFDISIVRISSSGNVGVVATTGDSYLGGEDFDERIVEWLRRGFELEHGIDLSERPVALQRLKQAAQKAKCELSAVDRTAVELPFIVQQGPNGPVHMHYEISRAQLEELTQDLVERTTAIVDHMMRHAGLAPGDVDEVVLVGGQTRMPRVRDAVQQYFGKAPNRGVHPDEVVALGAAIQAGILADEIDDVSLEDVTAHALGIATAGDHFQVIIPANSRVPTRAPSPFTTSRDGQQAVKIIVLQGSSPRSSENELLQEFQLAGLRPAPAGQVVVEVAFEIDEDGIFSVSAKDTETGEETRIEVNGESGVSPEELERLAAENRAYLDDRRREEALEGMRQSLRTMVEELQRKAKTLATFQNRSADAAPIVARIGEVAAAAAHADIAQDRASMVELIVELEALRDTADEMIRETDAQRSLR